jgi:hypothetical protein
MCSLLQSHTYNHLVRCVTFTQLTILHANIPPRTISVSCREPPATVACRKPCLLVKVILRLTVSQPVSLGVKPHQGLMARYLLLFDSYSLVFVRGRVCLLYMLLALASAVFLGSESLSTRDHILLSQI